MFKIENPRNSSMSIAFPRPSTLLLWGSGEQLWEWKRSHEEMQL